MSALTEQERAVLQAIIRFFDANPDGLSWPQPSELARDVSLPEHEVIAAGDSLAERDCVILDRSMLGSWASVLRVTESGRRAAAE